MTIAKILWTIFAFQLCCICVVTDARMPNCEGRGDKCQCHRSYTNYENDSNKRQRNCLKTFTEKKNWDSALQTCTQEFSTLLHTRVPDSFFQDFKNRAVNLIWIGIRKRLAFYIVEAPTEHVFKPWNSSELTLEWEADEPVFECVALTVGSGRLVTQDCATELEYVCQNFGFPVYPVTNSLICPKDWQIFYQLPIERINCIKPNKKRLDTNNETATCLKFGSKVSNIQDFGELYVYMSKLNIQGYDVTNYTLFCLTKFVESALGINLNVTCSDEVFICERKAKQIYLKPKVSPDFPQSVLDYSEGKQFLTCEVPFQGPEFNEIENQLHYVWYKDGIPIPEDSRILDLITYLDPVKQLNSSTIRQGTYSCSVTAEGIKESFSSQFVKYFYADVRTYTFTFKADLREVGNMDYSSQNFPLFRESLEQSMVDILTNFWFYLPHVKKTEDVNPEWDYQMSWKNEDTFTIQLLLYVKRQFPFDNSEFKSHHELEKALKGRFVDTRETPLKRFMKLSLKLGDADFCSEQAIPSSSSNSVTLLWNKTPQTKFAVSEPMCLNDWRLITRECRPSVVWGATWGRLDESRCTKVQYSPDKDFQFRCPEGYKYYNPNLCYVIFNEQKSFHEAGETCKNQSSFLADLKLLGLKPLIANLDDRTFWVSNRKDVTDGDINVWFQNGSTLMKRNLTLFCGHVINKLIYKYSPLRKCGLTESHPFICFHQQFSLLNSFAFSKPWFKYSDKKTSFYIDGSKKNWPLANKSCHAFPGKSTLLQSIRHLEEYSKIIRLVRQMPVQLDGYLWMNLFQNGDSLKWMTRPEENPTFAQWSKDTDFFMDRSAGVIDITVFSNQWSLRGLESKHGSICELQDLQDSHCTAVYIEDRTRVQAGNFKSAYEADIQCVPSGWFIWDSIAWLKEGKVQNSINASQQHRHLTLNLPFTMENVSEFQGYYYCSVVPDKASKPIFSAKLLIKYPGLHTFVLRVKSEMPVGKECSNITLLEIPIIAEFQKYINTDYNNRSGIVLKDVECKDSVITTYHHIYIIKDTGNEKTIQSFLELDITSEKGDLFEALRRLDINKKEISIKSTVSCSKETSSYNGRKLTWPETLIGHSTLSEEMCITVEGRALGRKCLGDFYSGAKWSPVERNCVDVRSNVTITLHQLARTNITNDNILESTQRMETLTTTSEDLSPSDVHYVAQVLGNVARVPAIKPEVLRSVVHTVDAVINTISTSENKFTSSNVPSKINSAVEKIAINAQINDEPVKVAGNNIAISVLRSSLVPRGGVLENWGSNVTVMLNDSNKNPEEQLQAFKRFEAAVLLPENVLTEQLRKTNVVIAVRRNVQFIHNITVQSPVIDVAIGTDPMYDVDPPIEMVFKVPMMSSSEMRADWGCASWDKRLHDSFGGWSYKGCISVLTDPTNVRCYCDHLTSFTVILEVTSIKLPKVHTSVLSFITIIGCSLSIFGLGTVILTFLIFKKWRSEMRHKVLFNISLSLVSLLLTFLIGIEQTQWGYGCVVIAILLHYFMLTSFCWMLVEAFLQYLCLVKVIGTYIPRFLHKAMIFAWGMPVVVIGVILCVNHQHYESNTEFCWLTGNVFYFAVALPVLILLSINFIMFGVIFCSVACRQSNLRSNQDDRKEMIQRAKAMFCVSVLLGLSWVFGFMAAMEGTKVFFQYLFVITTTLQGFLFSVFFVIRRKKTRDLWLNMVRTTATSSSSHSTELKQLT